MNAIPRMVSPASAVVHPIKPAMPQHIRSPYHRFILLFAIVECGNVQHGRLLLPRPHQIRSSRVREKFFLLRIRRLPMGNAEKVPLTILGPNERVVVDVPSFRFPHRRIINFIKFIHSKCRRRSASNGDLGLRRIRHQSPGRGESRNHGSACKGKCLQYPAAYRHELVFCNLLAPHNRTEFYRRFAPRRFLPLSGVKCNVKSGHHTDRFFERISPWQPWKPPSGRRARHPIKAPSSTSPSTIFATKRTRAKCAPPSNASADSSAASMTSSSAASTSRPPTRSSR